MLLHRRVSRKGLIWGFQQISGFSDWSWVNFTKPNAQGGIVAFWIWCLALYHFPNSNIPTFFPLRGAGPSFSSPLSSPQIAAFFPVIPIWPPWNQRALGRWGELPGRARVDPKGFQVDSQGIPTPELSQDPTGGTR